MVAFIFTVSQPKCNYDYVATLPLIKEGQVRLALFAKASLVEAGWVLLRGGIQVKGYGLPVTLIVETGETGEVAIPLPVSLRGNIIEVIKLPNRPRGLFLQFAEGQDSVTLREFSLKSLGLFEVMGRMWRRVIPTFFQQRAVARQRLGLAFYTPLFSLPKAYRIAGRFRAFTPPLSYPDWHQQFAMLTVQDLKILKRQMAKWPDPPIFEVVVNCLAGLESFFSQTISSLREQIYLNFRVNILSTDDRELTKFLSNERSLNSHGGGQIRIISPEDWSEKIDDQSWLVFLSPGSFLASHTLYWLATQIGKKKYQLIYADHDYHAGGELFQNPEFKPDWSPELLRSINYIGESFAIKAELLAKLAKIPSYDFIWQYYDILLRASEVIDSDQVGHISAALWHLPNNEKSEQYNLQLVRDHYQRLGIKAQVKAGVDGGTRIIYDVPDPHPRVSIIIPNKNKVKLLKACLDSLLAKTAYGNYEVLIVDNQSSDPAVLAYYQELRLHGVIRLLSYDRPFNYSAINNMAVAAAKGEIICLLNNDTAIINNNWLIELVGQLAQKQVGVVGAKLFYSDGTVQHGGDVVGPGGCANHLHGHLAGDDPGYCQRAVLTQNLSAVTAACLVTWRHLYQDLGGFDQENLGIAFNDVDYCLRVRQAGWQVIWTPNARLYHYESVSRGQDVSEERKHQAKLEVKFMRQKWGHLMNHDPFYNQNLSYNRPDFSLSNAPLVQRPWRK